MSARREAILREMGLAPLWRLRGAGAASDAVPDEPAPRAPAEPAPQRVTAPVAPRVRIEAPTPAAAAAPAVAPPVAAPVDAERAARIAAMNWDELAQATSACTACRLCEQRKQAVLGVGDRAAELLLVGEGPGAEEDERGEPFVGQAGKLLDAMLASIGLARGQGVYIANTVKCRPPNNRTPEPDEIAACHPFLARQIALLQPKVIVALGRPAAQTLLDAEVKIASARRQEFAHAGLPTIVTYHPAYLLRNLGDKAKAWEDLCFVRATLRKLDSKLV